MKISEKQLLMLVDIAQDTCRMGTIVGGYTPQVRVQLVNDIINQQSNIPTEVEPDPKEVESDTDLKLSDLAANDYGMVYRKTKPRTS